SLNTLSVNKQFQRITCKNSRFFMCRMMSLDNSWAFESGVLTWRKPVVFDLILLKRKRAATWNGLSPWHSDYITGLRTFGPLGGSLFRNNFLSVFQFGQDIFRCRFELMRVRGNVNEMLQVV